MIIIIIIIMIIIIIITVIIIIKTYLNGFLATESTYFSFHLLWP